MDIKVVWPLLRKANWTARPPTGLDVHFDYVKPGCSRKTGTRGVDYFNGEDELLAYVRGDKDLCARHGISNVIVRSRAPEASDSLHASNKRPGRAKRIPQQPPEDKSAKTTTRKRAKQTASPAQKTAKTPKKKNITKKQMTEDAARRRRELAAFDKVWGDQNATATDGTPVRPPRVQPLTPESTHRSSVTEVNAVRSGLVDDTLTSTACTGENADARSTADDDTLPIDFSADTRSNADDDTVRIEANADSRSNTDKDSVLIDPNADTRVNADKGRQPVESNADVDREAV